MDRGAWWAMAVHKVVKSWTCPKRLSTHSTPPHPCGLLFYSSSGSLIQPLGGETTLWLEKQEGLSFRLRRLPRDVRLQAPPVVSWSHRAGPSPLAWPPSIGASSDIRGRGSVMYLGRSTHAGVTGAHEDTFHILAPLSVWCWVCTDGKDGSSVKTECQD